MGISAGGRVQVLDRHIYLNRQAHPEQTSGTVRVLHLFTNFDLNPGKFNLIGSINYQTSDNDTIISLPKLSARLKFTFTQVLFKGTATVQPGFSISYNTPYYANAYMPALRAFYLQNTKKIGGYPYVDVFLGLKVKRSNLFVRYTNLYAFAGDHSYYTVPGYPQRDPTFYFGVSWRFYE
jgi:outer membrane cobalamin receptor